MILGDCKRQLTLLAVAWIDYLKDYDMVPQSWIQKYVKVFGVVVKMKSFFNALMNHWNTELTAENQRLGNVKMKRGIFEGDCKFALLIVFVMIPLTLASRQTKASYEVKKEGRKINHLLFMDDLKLFAKNEDQIDSLVNTVRIFSEETKM